MQNRTIKIRRNGPCPCGSGLKYKKCCLERKQAEAAELRLWQLQAELKEKLEKSLDKEVVLLEPNSHPIKMSEVILEFAEDMLRHSDTRTEKKQAIEMACLAWNLALIKQQNDEEYERALAQLLKQKGLRGQPTELRQLLEALINKKIKEYAEIDRMIVRYQIDFEGGELMLNVASTIAPEEVGE